MTTKRPIISWCILKLWHFEAVEVEFPIGLKTNAKAGFPVLLPSSYLLKNVLFCFCRDLCDCLLQLESLKSQYEEQIAQLKEELDEKRTDPGGGDAGSGGSQGDSPQKVKGLMCLKKDRQ